MTIELAALPYTMDALEPLISRATLRLHYGAHHQAYVDATNSLIAGTNFADMSLESIIRASARRWNTQSKLFNNAAQAWNHAFLWNSMCPAGGGSPSGEIRSEIEQHFGGLEGFTKLFHATALQHFGSGWAWLVLDQGKLKILTTANADTPLAQGQVPLLNLDLWEHAYYLDYQNRRSDYIANFLSSLVNWEFANRNLTSTLRNEAAE
jgi:superoxide dismutase, Fe-Mn family